MQHDTFSWLIDDRSFVHESSYTEKSTRIVNAINHALNTYDEETKHQFIDTLFDFFEKLHIEKLPNEKEFIAFFLKRIPSIFGVWKETPKENRSIVKKIIFDILKDYFFGK